MKLDVVVNGVAYRIAYAQPRMSIAVVKQRAFAAAAIAAAHQDSSRWELRNSQGDLLNGVSLERVGVRAGDTLYLTPLAGFNG